jgi:tetratricopeptide (TPR) repeat protein
MMSNDRGLIEGHRFRNVLFAVALFLVTAALYWPACDNAFVNLDDNEYVTANPNVLGGLSPDGLTWAATTHHAANWHPLTWWSLQLDAQLFGSGPLGFHRTNVLFHAANAALLFLALDILTGFAWRSAAVALLFGVHPQHVESVAWVAERKDVLSGFFFLLTLLLYARYALAPTKGRMIAVVVTLALGLAAKPMLVTAPFVFMLLDYWPLGRLKWPGPIAGRRAEKVRPLIVEKIPLFAMCLISAVLTVSAQGNKAIRSLESLPFGERAANAVVSYVAYLGQLIYPVDLALFYPYPPGGYPGWQIAGALLLITMITAVAALRARRQPYLLVGWLWYVGMLVPVIGLVQVGEQARADRYTYLPQIGLLLAVVWAGAEVVAGRPWGRRLAAGAVIAATLAGAFFTRSQIAVWKDGRALWEHTLAVTRENYVAEAGLADLDLEMGDKAGAAARVERALQIRPGNPSAEKGLAELLIDLGRPADAIEHYREAVRLIPKEAGWRARLTGLLLDAGRLEEAQAEYSALARSESGGTAGLVGLGRVAVRRGKPADAAALFVRARGGRNANDPDFVLATGHALAEEGWYEEATVMYARAIQLRPADAPSHAALGNMKVVQSKWAEAAAEFAQAHRLASDVPSYSFALAHAQARAGQRAEAEKSYIEALRLAPGWPERVARSAWEMATHPDQRRRLGTRAVQLAEQASEARGGRSAELLDVVAAAYAEVGRWDDAVSAADRGATLADGAGQNDLAAQIRARRDLYNERKPYRQATAGR